MDFRSNMSQVKAVTCQVNHPVGLWQKSLILAPQVPKLFKSRGALPALSILPFPLTTMYMFRLLVFIS